MVLENIRYELRPPLAVVTIDRPKVLNALNRLSMTELEQVFRELGQNADVRVILLTGAGEKAFVAGADISELASLSPLEGEQLATRGQRIFQFDRELRQAGDRLHQWLRPRWRLRAGACLHPAPRQLHRPPGATGSQDWHHSRLWRNPAPAAPDRQGCCAQDDSYRRG